MTMARDMDCDEVRRLLDAFGDGELDPQLREAVENHLRVCADCRREHEESAAALEAFLTLGRNAAPAPADDALATRILRNARAEPRRRAFAIRLVPAAAAVLILGLALGILWRRGAFSRPEVSNIPRPVQVVRIPPVIQPVIQPVARPTGSADERIARALFAARLEAAEAASAAETKPAPDLPNVCLTASEIYAQIPAIMLVAADQVNYEAGDKVEAGRKYARIVELFPESKQARIAAVRLANFGTHKGGTNERAQ